jgi:hypothetical protein
MRIAIFTWDHSAKTEESIYICMDWQYRRLASYERYTSLSNRDSPAIPFAMDLGSPVVSGA